jgi:hypothetical protein
VGGCNRSSDGARRSEKAFGKGVTIRVGEEAEVGDKVNVCIKSDGIGDPNNYLDIITFHALVCYYPPASLPICLVERYH